MHWEVTIMEKPIYEGGGYHVLSDKEISQIHETSIRVLGKVGFEINYPPALELFEKNGARVDHDLRRVYLSRELVSRCIKQAPSEFVFYGRQKGKKYYNWG
jgi:trimethylamine---corrinoid protein Co-methyltransferase